MKENACGKQNLLNEKEQMEDSAHQKHNANMKLYIRDRTSF